MYAYEAQQVFFDEEDANVPIAQFSDSDLPESDDGDDVELTDDWAGYPSSPDEETASLDEENLYGGSGQPSADGESSSESESDDDYPLLGGNLDNITSPERVEMWFFGFSDFSAFKIYGTSYLQKFMVVELFAHTVGVVKNCPFLPNYSGPIRVRP